jgi:hypothetical protein
MRPTDSGLIVLQGFAAIVLFMAAMQGNASLHSNGLHVERLAHETIAFTILGVCVFSCALAALLEVRATESWNRPAALGFLGSVVVGWLAASAFANTQVTINGASAEWISWPAMMWLVLLASQFVLRATNGQGAPEDR